MPLNSSPIGSVARLTGFDARFGEDFDVPSFIPHDLPARLTLPGATAVKTGEAMASIGRLDAAAQILPNHYLLSRLATRREAIGTSALEGTYADLTELLAAEALADDESDPTLPTRVREVMNYARAAEMAYGWIKERPITLSMLNALQTEIVRGTESDGPSAGAIREVPVFIGAKHRRVTEARFVPPPPGDQLRAMLERLVSWLTADEPRHQIPLIARVAMVHYQFETLHPFTDGNGRLGRLVAMLQVMSEGALRRPVLSVSPWLEERATEYRDHLLEVSRSGDFAPWIDFFADAFLSEASAAHDRVARLLALRKELGEQVRTALPRARLAVDITDDLIAYPLLSVADAQRRFGRSNQANRNAIASLVDLGILEPFGSATYERLFWNKRVLDAAGG